MPGADARHGDGSRQRDATAIVAWHVVLVVAVVLVVYANALPNAFLWDDVFLVVGNPAIKRWDALPRLFTSDLFPGGIASGYYRPLQALTYAADYGLWGVAPAGFHLTNVLLHAATAALLCVVGARVLGAPAAALAAALLFAIHPLHVEAVTYVSGRSDPLAAVFLLLAVLGFLRGDGRGRALSLAAFFLALLAREAALVLPLLLVVIDRILCLAAGWSAVALPARAWRRPAWLAVACVVVALGGLTMRRNLDWRDGRTLYERLLPLAPDSMRVRVNLAEAYQQAGELDRARVAYEEVLRRRPNEHDAADALNNLGNLERGAGRTTEALAAYDRALALQPRRVAARNGRALALQALGRSDEAERELDAALALDPDSATTHSNLGNLYFRRDEIARARDAYLAAVRLDPGHADAHNNLGSAYFRLGDRAHAEAEYRTALRLDPRSTGAERNLAIVLGASPADRPGP